MVDQTNWKKIYFKIVFFIAIIILPNLFPLYQLFLTKGYLFYQNAFDEYSYLSYEAASFEMGFLRLSRYLVKWLHELGFSAGYINFVFDLICPSVTGYFIYKIFIILGFDKNKSFLAAVLIMMTPVLFGGSNPAYSKIFYSTLSSGLVYWLVIPEAYYPPFYRTPEPQFSYLLMVLAIYLSIKRKTFIPLYLAAPFLYGFLRVPFLFIVFSCHLSEVNRKYNFVRVKYANWLIGFVSYAMVSVMVGLYYEFALKEIMKADFFPTTRLPILSGTFGICLLIWKFLPRHNKWENSGFYAFVVAAPLVAVNSQIISGFISQPINFEQSFGVVCISFLATILVLSFREQKWVFSTLGIVGILLSVVFSIQIFRVNSNPVLLEKPPQGLIKALREDSFSVVFENNTLGSTMSMILSQQSYTALAISQSYGFSASKYFDRYLCFKEKIKQNPGKVEKYKSALMALDKAYKYLHSDFVFVHLNRRDKFRTFFDVDKKPENCDSRKLYFYPQGE
jgi:hypothetical protein